MLKKKTKLYVSILVVVAMLMMVVSGCSQPAQETAATTAAPAETTAAPDAGDDETTAPAPDVDEQEHYVIGFSNSSVSNSWAAAYHTIVVNSLAALDNVTFYTTDGNDDSTKQIADVEDLLARDIDLLIIRPNNPEALSAVVEKAYDSGVPVIVSGRGLITEKYTSFVMTDDFAIGKAAAENAVELLEGKFGSPQGKVFVIQGAMQAGSAISRNNGMMEVFEQYPEIDIVAAQPADYQRAMGRTVAENVLQAQPELDLIIAAGGEMLVGAIEAIEAEGRLGEAMLVGVDGYNGLLIAMHEGKVDYTVLYPVTLGAETVEVAMKVLQGEDVPQIWEMPLIHVTPDNVEDYVDLNAPENYWAY